MAATPETVKQLAGLGLEVLVESRAGAAAGHGDEDYRQAGARIVADLDPAELDVLAHVRPLEPATARSLKWGAVTVGFGLARLRTVQPSGRSPAPA